MNGYGWWSIPTVELLTEAEAEAAQYAAAHGVELFADNPDAPHSADKCSCADTRLPSRMS